MRKDKSEIRAMLLLSLKQFAILFRNRHNETVQTKKNKCFTFPNAFCEYSAEKYMKIKKTHVVWGALWPSSIICSLPWQSEQINNVDEHSTMSEMFQNDLKKLTFLHVWQCGEKWYKSILHKWSRKQKWGTKVIVLNWCDSQTTMVTHS